MTTSTVGRNCLRLLVLAALPAAICYAQGDRGLITGLVTDSSGASVAGASIRALHVATNVAVKSETNAEGNFTLNFLPPGQYTVSAAKAGFKPFERTGVQVRVNDRLTLNITLQVGEVSEKIVVTAEGPLLETTNSGMSTAIDHRRLTEMPTIYGNPLMLQFLASGTTWNAPLHYQAPWDTSGPALSSVNGSKMRAIDFQVDGISNNNKSNEVAYNPSVEFLEEFKVETLAYDASQGHGAAWVNAILKSGTNQVHGSVYAYFQNKALNANGFFSNLAGQPKGDFDYSRWQGSAGGPIVKNKTFWFAGVERIVPGSTTRRTFTVPTPAEKSGDLSALLKLGSQYQIYDPWTTTNLNNGRYSRTPFANNIIPASRISDIAKNVLKYYPDPNDAPSPTPEGLNNYLFKEGYNRNTWLTLSARVDHNFTDRDRIFVRFGFSDRTLNENGYDFAKGASAGNSKGVNKVGALSYTHTFGPSTVSDIRYGYTRSYFGIKSMTAGFDLATLGFPQSLADQVLFRQFPQFTFGSNSYSTTNIANPAFNYVGMHSLIGSVARTQGRHMMRMGVDFRGSLTTSVDHTGESGVFSFTGAYMNGPLDTAPTPAIMASSMGGFLLGLPSSAYVNWNASSAGSVHTTSLFFQDDWKVSPRLTLNMGLRYEYESPPVERFNRAVRGFDYDVSSPVEAAAKAAYALAPVPELPPSQFRVNGGLTFLGVDGQPRALYDAPKRNFMPRFGFAWNVTSGTVLRGGYGIFFDQLGLTVRNFNQTGFSQATNYVASLDNGVTFLSTLSDPFPNGLLRPAGAKNGIATNLGRDISFQNTKLRTPYNQRWSFGVQRILPAGFLIDATYVGNRGTALETSRSRNYVPGQLLSTSMVRDQATIDRVSRNVPNPMAGLLPGTNLNGVNTTFGRLFYAYPQFGSVSTSTNEGYSWYHSLQTRVERRFTGGYTFMGAWTWAKNMEATGFLNPFDARPERVISAQDRTHRITFSGIYELPFGHGRRFLPNTSRLLGLAVDGWQLGGVYQFQTGEPLGLGDFIYYGDATQIVLPRSERDRLHWFNTAGFETNTARQRASAVRYQSSRFAGLRAAPVNVLDLSAIKKGRITERFSFELRAEALSALNHQIFDVPNTSASAGTFGTVTATKGFSNRRIQFGLYLRF
ncbi:MAG: carboxypeptidase regulatory-like domain-containing protein [Bryobacteraceae bacterium]|nr:carboxypeptidase regulatory-like domain-containing protein [Bryobacteraceae bacterium]